MGGTPKGLLRAPGGRTIVERWAELFDRLGIERTLVGRADPYASLGWPTIDDDPGAEGPLAGLIALLERAGERHAIAVACDMPFATEQLVRALVEAPAAPIVAPRREGRWEPLFARYDAARVLPIAREQARARSFSLQALLDRAGAVELAVDRWDELADWDEPCDLG